MPHRFLAGVDLGATNARVVIANDDGEVEARRAFALPDGPPERVLAAIGRTIEDLARGVWVGARAAAIGVAVPGAVDPSHGNVMSVANMPGWDDVPIGALLGGDGKVAVAIENDANAAALGEGWLGAAKGLDHHVFVALGTGIGAGLVLNGRLYRGAHALAGEVAYFPMTRRNLHVADWQHCLEGYVGGRNYAAKASELLGEGATADALFDAARSGNRAAAAWLQEVQEHLALAVCDLIALLDPQIVVLGGGVTAAQGERFVAEVRGIVHKSGLPVRTPVFMSELGPDAQLMGAVRIAREAASQGS
jgi:glucokinase